MRRTSEPKKRPRLMSLADRRRYRKSFGARLSYLRKSADLTAMDFYRISGIDPGNLRKYEHGKREPGLTTIMLMSKALKISPQKFFVFPA